MLAAQVLFLVREYVVPACLRLIGFGPDLIVHGNGNRKIIKNNKKNEQLKKDGAKIEHVVFVLSLGNKKSRKLLESR